MTRCVNVSTERRRIPQPNQLRLTRQTPKNPLAQAAVATGPFFKGEAMKAFITRSLEAMSFILYFLIIIGGAVMGAKGGGMMGGMMMGGRRSLDGDIDPAGLLLGALGGFIIATILFGTLFLLMEIRDLLKAQAGK